LVEELEKGGWGGNEWKAALKYKRRVSTGKKERKTQKTDREKREEDVITFPIENAGE